MSISRHQTQTILETVKEMPNDDLELFLAQVLKVRAERFAPQPEALQLQLLNQINQTLPPLQRAKFEQLVEKRDSNNISELELEELISMIDEIEARDVERLKALIELSQIRGITLDELMQTLGINRRKYDQQRP
jgi:hypothetical protein